MIVRSWTARARPAQAPAYAEHLRSQVLPALQALEGYEGALLLERQGGDEVELVVLTLWRSPDAIRAFAGDDLEAAVVADEAAAVLTHFDERVHHYEVVTRDRV